MANQLTAKNTFIVSTAGTPAATDVVATNEIVFVNPTVKTAEEKCIGDGKAGSTKTYSVADMTTADFTVPMCVRGSGTAGTAPEAAELLKCCALKETVNAGTDVTYTPELTGVRGTAKNYMDGFVREITGIAGEMTLSGKVGERAVLSFALKGFTTASAAAEANPSVTLDTNAALIVTSATAVTVGGSTIELTGFELKTGNDIQQNYAIGVKEYYVRDFAPELKINAIKTKGNEQHWSDLESNTVREVVIILGTTAGNKVTITASSCNPKNVSENDDNGKVVYEQTYLCQSSAGGDNFSIVFE